MFAFKHKETGQWLTHSNIGHGAYGRVGLTDDINNAHVDRAYPFGFKGKNDFEPVLVTVTRQVTVNEDQGILSPTSHDTMGYSYEQPIIEDKEDGR